MILRKSRKLKHQPAYLIEEAHDLYDQAHGKYIEASDALHADAEWWTDHILDLRAQLAEAQDEHQHTLVSAEACLDMAEHLERL